jgi:5-methylthioadenosine/S-adenosylhomocysteine deaminase
MSSDVSTSLELLIKGGRVLVSGSDGKMHLAPRNIGVADGRIVLMEGHHHQPRAAVVLDVSGMLVTPGFVNAHTHSYAATSPGMGADAPLDVLIPAAREQVGTQSAEDRYSAARGLAMSLLRSGVTTVLDQPAQGVTAPFSTAQAYHDVGMRAFVAPMVSDLPYDQWLEHRGLSAAADARSGPANGRTEDLLSEVEGFVSSWLEQSDLVRPALGPFAPGVCSDPLLRGLGDLAARYGLPMHTHLAEAKWQAEQALRTHGKRLVRRLADLELLGPTFSMAHGIWLDDEEVRLLGGANVTVVHNPLSNLMLGNGIAPVRRLRAAGVGIALGSDGLNCGCVTDFFEHLRLSVAVHRPGHDKWQEWHRAQEALAWATEGGARALGLAGEVGQIRLGLRADLVVHRGSRQHALDSDAALTSLVYTGAAADVLHVLVDGHLRVKDGKLTASRRDQAGTR